MTFYLCCLILDLLYAGIQFKILSGNRICPLFYLREMVLFFLTAFTGNDIRIAYNHMIVYKPGLPVYLGKDHRLPVRIILLCELLSNQICRQDIVFILRI